MLMEPSKNGDFTCILDGSEAPKLSWGADKSGAQ